MALKEWIIGAMIAIPALLLLLPGKYWHIGIYPIIMAFILIRLMRKRIGGYTGDCCGAMFLLCEQAFYIGMMIAVNVYVEP
jgi:adenosylcobinamide-GDP ribazoletransferase